MTHKCVALVAIMWVTAVWVMRPSWRSFTDAFLDACRALRRAAS